MTDSEAVSDASGGSSAATVGTPVSEETGQAPATRGGDETLDVVVLAGGISHERDVSLRSGRRVADALSSRGHRVSLRDPDAGLLPYLTEHRPDVVFPALHGSSGEDGSLLELLAALSIPTVGSTGSAARRAWWKPIASSIVGHAGLSVPASIVLSQESFRELGAAGVLRVVRESLAGDLVVKPAAGGSAQGVTIVETHEDLPRAMVNAFTYSETAVIERRIVGTEIAVTVLETETGTTALPAVEIVPTDGVYSFQARYNAGETTFFVPARLSDELIARASEAASAAHHTLGLRDISRIDFIIDDAGTPWFLEANVLPGLTETSLAPLAIEATGRDVAEAYDALVRGAVARG